MKLGDQIEDPNREIRDMEKRMRHENLNIHRRQ